jgi:poly(hydroxyalkanoate) depolymerase family esterase
MTLSSDSSSAPAGQVVEGRYTGPEGTRAWRLYVPGGAAPARARPLLVLLHGCLQDPADLARGTRMDAAAEAGGFLVLSPEQPASANPRRCWNWFEAAHQGQGGEPALLRALVADVVRQHGADPQRVHLAGISAGGAMATLLAVAYPELVASLTTMAGIPWKGATSLQQALPVMQRGAGAALPLGEALLAAMGEGGRRFPVLVVHGDQDQVVAPVNGEETAHQFAAWHALRLARSGAPPLAPLPELTGEAGGRPWRETRWVDGAGTPWVRLVRLAGTGHAWSGGSSDGSFTDAAGLSLTALVAAMVTGAPPSLP